MTTTKILEKDPSALFARAADTLFESMLALPTREHLVLGLCGGRSVVGLLGALRACAGDSPDKPKWSSALKRLHIFMVDERLVPWSDEFSNYGMLKRLLFDELVASGAMAAEQIHPFSPKPEESDFGTSEYLEELNRYGGAFSAIVLGMGEDGHVAGLFPHNATLQRGEKRFLSFFDSPKPPPARMTASVPLLSTAEVALLLVTGEAKREAWTRFQRPDTAVADCPSVFVKGLKHAVLATDLE